MIEALSCGRPVIASNVGGIPELVNGQCGILVAPKNAHALADAIDTAMNRKWDEQAIAAQFQRSWEESAAEIFSVCELAIQQHQSARGQLTGATVIPE